MTLEPLNAEPPLRQEQNLNALYGEPLEPTKIDLLEARIRPRSLHRLADDTAGWLKAFMKATEEGLGITRYVYCELPILWVADAVGDIWFAVEEIVTGDTHEFVLPRLRHASIRKAIIGLGTRHYLARVRAALEVKSCLMSELNRQLGLFQIHLDGMVFGQERKPEHLANIGRKFRDYEIILSEQFIAPRE